MKKEINKKELASLYHDLDGLTEYIKHIEQRTTDIKLNQHLKLIDKQLLICKEDIVASVVKDVMGIYREEKSVLKEKTDLTLAEAKVLIDLIEKEAKNRKMSVVIAVYNSAARPIAIHCMDNSYIASFDVAANKAYTCAALKMSTKELKKLSEPGQPLYGIQNTNQGKIVIFGGGEPLIINERLVGSLGISGGTEKEDTDLAEFGKNKLEEVALWR